MDNEELKKKIAESCRAVPGIIACYLFGSVAAGSHRMGSDLDLAYLLTSEIPLPSHPTTAK
jgi:predicted nucleotidyltransferase